MTAATLSNQHRTQVAFYFESTQGTTPANAAAWASAEGTDAFRHFCTEADPSFILGNALVENGDLQAEVFRVGDHHHGLPTADGGSIKMRLVGTNGSWTNDTQVSETAQGRLLQHALGAGARGQHTSVTTVTSQTAFTLASSSNLAVGHVICFEDADNLGVLYPAQVLTVAGADITIDRAMPFTVATSDKVYGTEMAWPDADALTNPADGDYSTLSLLWQKGSSQWMAGAAHLELQSIELERGMQPVLTFGVNAAEGYPPGAGAPTAPSWSGTIQGSQDVAAIGHGTMLFIQTKATTTWATLPVFSASLTVGVPVKPQDGVTEDENGSPGRVGYGTEPAATTLEVVVPLADAHQTKWTAGTEVTVTYFQRGAVGRGYALCMRECVMMGPPKPVFEQSNRYTLMLQAREDDSASAAALAAKLIIARW
jgi:hypothetical protein